MRSCPPETKEFFDFMMENELFDVFGRKDKKQGGYMTYLYQYHSPFIFANFNGTSGDVDVITHECGHAFQGYLSGRIRSWSMRTSRWKLRKSLHVDGIFHGFRG